jgi:hypothetical protein
VLGSAAFIAASTCGHSSAIVSVDVLAAELVALAELLAELAVDELDEHAASPSAQTSAIAAIG